MSAMLCELPTEEETIVATERCGDGELLVRYVADGDRRAFEELVHRYEREIFNYLHKYLGDRHLAEDAFQATFMQLHRKCRQFEPGRPVRPWLYRIAANQANDLLRRNRRHKIGRLDVSPCHDDDADTSAPLSNCLCDDREINPIDRLESAEDCQRVAAAVKRLPNWLKQPIVLVVYQGLKYSAAAEIIGIPLGTLKSRLYEAIRRVGRAIDAPACRRGSAA
ncbi:MAG TPA: RNA polymerase sigma factor [Pirellulales bacterium]